jgi:hypothetical protein
MKSSSIAHLMKRILPSWVGGRFNGGELPTTVLVDPQGNVRRRFVGARALPVFEAMLAEITQPQLSAAAPHPWTSYRPTLPHP